MCAVLEVYSQRPATKSIMKVKSDSDLNCGVKVAVNGMQLLNKIDFETLH